MLYKINNCCISWANIQFQQEKYKYSENAYILATICYPSNSWISAEKPKRRKMREKQQNKIQDMSQKGFAFLMLNG